jgi:hypothetical protein
MKKYLLAILFLCLASNGWATNYSFLTDSTHDGNYTEWRGPNSVSLANYMSGASAGTADSERVRVYVAAAGYDTLYPVIYNGDGTLLVIGTAQALSGSTGSAYYTLHFAHSGSIAANTRYWIGVFFACSGTVAPYTSAQNAYDSAYISSAGDPLPLGNMQENYRYLNSATDTQFPLKMNLWYSDGGGSSTKRVKIPKP